MKHLCIAVVASVLGAMSASAADQTWTGKISDSMCGANHNSSAEHGGKKISDRDCTLAGVKDHNAKYEFVSGGKVYHVPNQDFALCRSTPVTR
jgi:opacity protein-like surface antigen